MQYGSIPVYISDKFIIPHNSVFAGYGMQVAAGHSGKQIIDSLMSFSKDEIESLQHGIAKYYSKYFTFEANKKLIEEDLKRQL